MSVVALQLFKSVFARPGPFADDPFLDRHLDSPLVAHLATHPAILAQVEPLLGADLMVWRSIFFSKGPTSMEVPWHQDSHFWDLDPPITLTAWLAIDRAHGTDHCMEVVPGSHRTALPHVPSAPGSQFQETTAPGSFDLSRAVELPVDAGMFVLFDQRLVHRSRGGGQARRLALSVRIAPSHVRIARHLLPPGGRVLPVGWRSLAETPLEATRSAVSDPSLSS
jgi:ectoine hydroxylase-related dioxygenase (phytanoyl-CoA dioxygenase family)